MLRVFKSSFVRSMAVVAIVGGVGAWNYKSTTLASCYYNCWSSSTIWCTFTSKAQNLCGAFYAVTYEGGQETPANWLGACTRDLERPGKILHSPRLCVALYPQCEVCGVRKCCCSGCWTGPGPCCAFEHISNATINSLPCSPAGWATTCKGLCLNGG
jgi:hypothetical protein